MESQSSDAPPATAPARPGGRGAPAALRLEERPSSDRRNPRPFDRDTDGDRPALLTRARLRVYPGGECEVTVTRRPSTTPLRGRKPRAEPIERPELTILEQAQDFERRATRARSMVRRLVQAGQLDHLLTLTYRANQTDMRQCFKDLTCFLRLVRRLIPGYRYVAVLERQKRGAGHWHLAVAGRQPVRELRALWLRVVGEGNIDVRSWERSRRPGECAARLANYLAKYVSKSINERTELAHRYRRSHNIIIEERIEEYQEPDLERVAITVFWRAIAREPAFLTRSTWNSQCFIWACSWGGIPDEADRPAALAIRPTD